MLSICALLLCNHTLFAQVLQSNHPDFYIAPGAHVFINGGAVITDTLQNEGELTVTKNSTFPQPGNFSIQNGFVNGNGVYNVEQDWINDGTFNGDLGTVILFGNTQQFITSLTNTVTVFHHLTLTGNGLGNDRKKTLLNVDARTDLTGILTINDRELTTGPQLFNVLNPDVLAVQNDQTPGAEGFVSSTEPGYFSRVMNSTSPYLFPTGSSAGTLRYRPLLISPNDANPNVFSTRLNNYDANLDDFDRSITDPMICRTNELFYHSIIRNLGASPVDMVFTYLPAADGDWSHVTHWTFTPTQWSMIEPFTTASLGIFSGVRKSGWNFPSDGSHPYILSEIRPETPVMGPCPTFCENTDGTLFTATGSSTGYFWTVPANATLASGQGTDQATIDWTTGSDYVYVSAIGEPGCNSFPDSCLPNVLPYPDASFTAATHNSPYTTIYEFENTDPGNNVWEWDFGDGSVGDGSTTAHDFPGNGTYEVTLTVNNEGCSAQTTREIFIEEFALYIPNAFTPNGDGYNQVFLPLSNADLLVELAIYNRWGEKIFTSSPEMPGWDGTYNGKPCPDGVYTYVVFYINKTTSFRETLTGHVTLLR